MIECGFNSGDRELPTIKRVFGKSPRDTRVATPESFDPHPVSCSDCLRHKDYSGYSPLLVRLILHYPLSPGSPPFSALLCATPCPSLLASTASKPTVLSRRTLTSSYRGRHLDRTEPLPEVLEPRVTRGPSPSSACLLHTRPGLGSPDPSHTSNKVRPTPHDVGPILRDRTNKTFSRAPTPTLLTQLLPLSLLYLRTPSERGCRSHSTTTDRTSHDTPTHLSDLSPHGDPHLRGSEQV